jgi:type I restriction enzyme S subunit
MSEWTTKRLGDLISIKHGYAFKGDYFSEGGPGPILLTPGNFAIGGGFKESKPKYYLGPTPNEFRLKTGDLVITMTDLSKAGDTLGYPALIPAGLEYLHNQRIGLVSIKDPNEIDKSFLSYALRTGDYRQHVLGGATGSTVRHTSPGRISDYMIRVPSLETQRSIAAVLCAFDEKIAINHRIERIAFDLADARYVQVSEDAAGTGPVGDLLELMYGRALPAADRVEGKFPVYGSGGVAGTHDRSLIAGPGVIVGRKGTVGSIYWSEGSFFPIDTTFYVQLHGNSVPMEFAFFMLRHLGLETMNSDSAVPGLNRSNALALQVRVPDEAELRSFHEEVRPLFALRESLSAESANLAELRDTLLPRLMSGEIRVRDAEKVVEDVT